VKSQFLHIMFFEQAPPCQSLPGGFSQEARQHQLKPNFLKSDTLRLPINSKCCFSCMSLFLSHSIHEFVEQQLSGADHVTVNAWWMNTVREFVTSVYPWYGISIAAEVCRLAGPVRRASFHIDSYVATVPMVREHSTWRVHA
jgi:hypothetical protein